MKTRTNRESLTVRANSVSRIRCITIVVWLREPRARFGALRYLIVVLLVVPTSTRSAVKAKPGSRVSRLGAVSRAAVAMFLGIALRNGFQGGEPGSEKVDFSF